ncbi:MAG: hypothetical protein HLUCCO02_07080 [Idiomarinaceae bacterium HL-53]|nr:MAG: hypothetical protein HLUCCO02_07080 [Idiomarinaceae bacterium HL-53]CUS47268.1 Putative negative regulator of RcsB-dependent stress response [Idiomarinaceae bacterium HL-53]
METEDQQVEQVKSFIKEYGPWIVGGLVVGLGLMFTWRNYQGTQLAEQQVATAEVKSIVDQIENANEGVLDANAALANLGESDYAALTRLAVAKSAVEAGEFEQATTQLRAAMNEATATEVKAIAAVRLARVELSMGNIDQAEAALTSVNQESFAAIKGEVMGDIELARGNREAARAAYASALESGDNELNRVLQMKLDNLAAAE